MNNPINRETFPKEERGNALINDTIDAVPVIRCAECKHHARSLFTSNACVVWCSHFEHHRPLDWFCADGRKAK